ncbi:MAG: tetratricopeptide repeat protein [Flavobacteriaceae bacterium]|jgi:signal transduction histidine kinase|nr:tetratricopeptide repeat protein [Flavobacteriaceae bacterium]
MKNRVRTYCFVLLVFFTFIQCTKQTYYTTTTDIDQLYAVQYDKAHKDSIAQSLSSKVKQTLQLSNNLHNRIIIDHILNSLRWSADSINFLKLSKKSIDFASRKNDLSILANTYNNIGMYYHDNQKLDSTFYYYIKTENIYKELHDSIKIGETKFYQARLLFEMGLHMESETKVSQSLSLLNKQQYNPINFEANQLMGLCLMERKNYEEAELYLKKAVEQILTDITKNKVLDQKRAHMAIGNAYGNLAEVCYKQNKFQEAKTFVLEGQKYLEHNSPIMLVSFLRNTLAQTNYRLTNNTKYIAEVIQSYKDDSILGNSFRMHYTAMDLAHLYLLEKNTITANTWAEKAYKNATKYKVIPQQVEALEFLLSNDDYEMRNQVKHLIKLRQTLTKQDNETRNTFARIAYETEIIELEKNKLKDIVSTISISGISLVLLLAISIFRFKLKAKNKELKLVDEQRKANENINELIIERNLIGIDIIKKERNRIAKDLHDSIVNAIFTIRFNLQLLETNNHNKKKILITELQKLENNTRAISHDLMDSLIFNNNKFLQLIKDHIFMQVNSWKTSFFFHSETNINFESFNAEIKVNLFFILREIIQNVNKYSKANKCIITFTKENNKLKLIVSDDGVGFNQTSKNKGFGIRNINERACKIKGELTINSQQNQGTIITLSIPFTNQNI